MKIIVLTGSIATGKSTVSNYLQRKGYPIIDLDILAKEVVQPGSKGLEALNEKFGSEILLSDGSLNRNKLGAMLFSDEKNKQQVNEILHPLIFDLMEERLAKYLKLEVEVVFLDIPLYYETKRNYYEDFVWLVYVPEKLQIQRLMERNNLTYQEAKQRVDSQISIEQKAKMADVVIDNSGSKEALYELVNQQLIRL